MSYFVYMLRCVSSKRKMTYVGYTKNLINRLYLHNSNKGAKYTKGNIWEIIYRKKFISKSNAMKYEYKLKKDAKKRLKIYSSS